MQHVEKIARPGIIDLVRGIIDDAKQLFLGQYELRKYQAQREVARATSVAAMAVIGVPVVFVGFILLVLAIVHILNELADLPLWESYGIVAIVLLVVGGGFLLAAKKRMRI
jgi:uncharacterized membrane-anchored protein